ncbi:glutamyl-tRNA reductase [Natroniella sulfidigena]|uniref:glutamyl-tRNA reductase n=1 Tax=Natroniella sulfidigena TaxID=723921 RepID=UPI00200B08D8|nr:glutamyl-tRNA reductase [Natroniella sulfidigena]
MELVVIGLNHKTASVEVREELSLSNRQQEDVLEQISISSDVKEGVILSTCNRTEIYLVAESDYLAKKFTLKLFKRISDLKIRNLKGYLYHYQNLEAVEHLFRVVSGLDSLVIGEAQILGQVKKAFKEAKRMEAIDTQLHRLFNESFKVGKRARSETKIDKNAASISYVAVELARQVFGSLSGEKVMILGAGEMSELTLKNLVAHGVEGVMVSNRTYENGKRLAEQFSGEVIPWEKLENWVEDVDIIISSTAAPHYVLHHEQIEEVMVNRKRPLFLIDIAVPRDIEPEIAELPEVYLYDIDDLEAVVNQNLEERRGEIEQVEEIIAEEREEFEKWLNYRQVVPVIKGMRERANQIKEQELNRALQRLANSKQNQEDVVEELSSRLVNKLLHPPTLGVKQLANSEGSLQKLEVIKEVFEC